MKCSNCGKEIPFKEPKFCPFCGTKVENPVLPEKMIVKGYLHGDKGPDYEQAEEIGLSEEATQEFVGWGYEVEFDLEVETKTGKTKIVAVNGHMLVY
jgi:hypothetical protein